MRKRLQKSLEGNNDEEDREQEEPIGSTRFSDLDREKSEDRAFPYRTQRRRERRNGEPGDESMETETHNSINVTSEEEQLPHSESVLPSPRRQIVRHWRRKREEAEDENMKGKEREFFLLYDSEIRRKRLKMTDGNGMLIKRAFHLKEPSEHHRHNSLIVSPQKLRKDETESPLYPLAGRTKALISLLTFWSLFFCLFGVVFSIYPVVSGAIDYEVIIHPLIDGVITADNYLRIGCILGQWNLPPQIIYYCFGPGGSILFGFIVMFFGYHKLEASHERFYRIQNPFNHAASACLVSQGANTIILGAYGTIYRFILRSANCPLLWLARILPHIVAIILASKISINVEIISLFLAILCSTVSIAMALIFLFLINVLQQLLPECYCTTFFRVSSKRHAFPFYYCLFLLIFSPIQPSSI